MTGRRGEGPAAADVATADAPASGVAASDVASQDRSPERGSVTAELAVALPAVVLVLVAVLALAASALTQLRCADAARAGARAAAIGEDASGVQATVTRVAGAGADVTIAHEGAWVTVSVSAAVGGDGLVSGPLVARASAVAWVEP